jgi:hypothetical protein
MSLHREEHDFPFTPGELCQACGYFPVLRGVTQSFFCFGKRSTHANQEFLPDHRFGQEIDCTAFDRPDTHGNVAMPGKKNDRQQNLTPSKFFLELQTVHSGHFHVNDDTAEKVGLISIQKGFCVLEGLHVHTGLFDHQRKRIAHGCIVIYDKNGGFLHDHGPKGRVKWNFAPVFASESTQS